MSYNKKTGMYEGYIYNIYNDVNDKLYIGQTITTIKDRWHGHMSSVLNEKRYKSALYNAMRLYGREVFHIREIDKLQYPSKELLIEELNKLETIRIKEYHSLTRENGYNLEVGGKNKKVQGCIVHKYDINMNYIATYESCQEAGRCNDINGSTIYGCCKHSFFTAGGYVWCFDGDNPVEPNYSSNIKMARLVKDINKHLSDKEMRYDKYDDRKIIIYNAFGNISNVYNNFIEAIDNIPISASELKKNLNGENLKYNRMVIRYADEPFDKYPMSLSLQPITIYDLQGNIVKNFECKLDAEKFLCTNSGELTKAIKRGGSCKGYLISEYGKPIVRKLNRWNKSILMINDDNDIIKDFNSISEINKYFNVLDCHHTLNKAIKNKTKYRGYYWEYKKEFEVNS